MKISYKHTYRHPREFVWQMLQDPQVIVRTLPGCRKLHPVGEGLFETELGLDLGPVKGLFTGTVRITDVLQPQRYRLLLHGVGKPGELSADSAIHLLETRTGTELVCEAEAHGTGVLAGMGQRVLAGVAKIMLSRFFKNVESAMNRLAVDL